MIQTNTRRTWNARQSWNYEELLIVRDVRGPRPGRARAALRIRIRSNAYDEQSSGVIERWDGAGWREVARRAGTELASRHGRHDERRAVNYTTRSLDQAALGAFDVDRETLLTEALAVLGLEGADATQSRV